MAGYIEGLDRQQATLFPERLDELVPGEALVRVIDGFVAQLDVQAAGFVRARPAGIGRPGYRPGDLLRLFLWGYLNGVRSSRMLERACWRDLEAAWLMCRLQPDFKTPMGYWRRFSQGQWCGDHVDLPVVRRLCPGAWADWCPAGGDRRQPVRGGQQPAATAASGGCRGRNRGA